MSTQKFFSAPVDDCHKPANRKELPKDLRSSSKWAVTADTGSILAKEEKSINLFNPFSLYLNLLQVIGTMLGPKGEVQP